MAEKVEEDCEDASKVDSRRSQRKKREKVRSEEKNENEKRKKAAKGGKAEEAPISFTTEEIDAFIDEARRRASVEEGTGVAWRQHSSQDDEEFGGHDLLGSQRKAQADSQVFHQAVRSRVEECLSSAAGAMKIGDLGSFVVDALKLLELQDCRPRSTTGKGELFPLPVALFNHQKEPHTPFLQAVLSSLNSLHSYGESRADDRISPSARLVCKRLEEVVKGSQVLCESLPNINFEGFFSQRGLDYSGEEVRIAQAISWKSIESSFPPEVGCLDIRDFCFGGVAHFINHIDDTILPVEDQIRLKPPSVMVESKGWEEIACGLVRRGLCEVIPEDEVFHVDHQPLLNGLFSVSKDEVKDGVPLSRLIMNLKPWNRVSRSLTGDVGTLPSITQLGSLHLHDDDVLVTSSEDLRCFFYLFKVPSSWTKYMAFAKEAPRCLVPRGEEHRRWFLAGRVLPMGYLNSVGIAQHIHRAVVQRAIGSLKGLGLTIQELRRDRTFSSFPNLFRVYLDNFDQLQKVDRKTAALVAGTPSNVVEQIRECYSEAGLPRHPKKTVQQALSAEVQGAWLDGEEGKLYAKPSKVAKYVRLALELLGRGRASQRELQVVGGGFVYIAMFNRPLLSSLNHIWRMIVESDNKPPTARFWLRREVMVELVRFVGLCPLSFMSFRGKFDAMVTASDASSTGGGIARSIGLTPYGQAASLSNVRGDVPEELELTQILSVGLFDGIAALRVALDTLKAPVAGHISVESNPQAKRVVERNFPDSILVDDVMEVDDNMIHSWALQFSTVGLVLIGAGPPCQGVSGLNSDRKGALRDQRSRLFQVVPKIVLSFKRHFPWAQVHSLTENVASMDYEDCKIMNEAFDLQPWFVDADGICLAHRPRLYWITWEIQEEEGVEIFWGTGDKLPLQGQVNLKAEVEAKYFLEKGWTRTSQKPFPTFTTSRPSSTPLRRPAGLKDCNPEEVQRWKDHLHRFPPYQYMTQHCLQDQQGTLRTPTILEREAIMGFPPNYTQQCMKKEQHGSTDHLDCRLSLVGNSWVVGVIAWLLQQLLKPLGIISPMSLQNIVDELTPGKSDQLQSLLRRPPFGQATKTFTPNDRLAAKLAGLVSLKGEDLMLQATSEVPVKYQRVRTGVPRSLWRWKPVSGWKWKGDPEHINVLEARAVFTTIKWRVLQHRQVNLRCIHLVDSLVVLHALTRGRSSSRKMRRTIMRISSYLLASGLRPLWAYINTKDNPADRPSRWGTRKRWVRK